MEEGKGKLPEEAAEKIALNSWPSRKNQKWFGPSPPPQCPPLNTQLQRAGNWGPAVKKASSTNLKEEKVVESQRFTCWIIRPSDPKESPRRGLLKCLLLLTLFPLFQPAKKTPGQQNHKRGPGLRMNKSALLKDEPPMNWAKCKFSGSKEEPEILNF